MSIGWDGFILFLITIVISAAAGGVIGFRLAEAFYTQETSRRHAGKRLNMLLLLLVFIAVMSAMIYYQVSYGTP